MTNDYYDLDSSASPLWALSVHLKTSDFLSAKLKCATLFKNKPETAVLQIQRDYHNLEALHILKIYFSQPVTLSYLVIQFSYLVIQWWMSLDFFIGSMSLKQVLLIAYEKREVGKISDWIPQIYVWLLRFWRSDSYTKSSKQSKK